MADQLNNFDMVLVLTQNAINSQLATLHRFAQADPTHANFPVTADWKTEAGTVTADLGAPTLSFWPSDGDRTSVTFVLPMSNGKIVDASTSTTIPITDWVLAFDVDLAKLDFGSAAQAQAASDGVLTATAAKELQAFPDDGFNVEALVLDFANADLSKLDADLTKTPGITDATQTILLTALRDFFKENNGKPFVLGANATSKNPAQTAQNVSPTLVPTGISYTVFPNDGGYKPAGPAGGISTLNLLTSTDGHAAPPASAGVFAAPFVTDNKSSGQLIVSRASLLDNFILKELGKRLGGRFAPTSATKLVMHTRLPPFYYRRPPTFGFSQSQLEITAELSTDAAEIKFSGSISSQVTFTIQYIWKSTWRTFQAAKLQGNMKISATQDAHGLVVDFAPFSFGSTHRTRPDEKDLGANVDEFLTVGLIDKLVDQYTRAQADTIKRRTENLLNADAANLPTVMVPPTGAKYALDPMAFNSEGDFVSLVNIEAGA